MSANHHHDHHHEHEPIEGLPQNLPEGEDLLWQGKPNPVMLAVHAFHIRSIAIYFGLLVLLRIVLSVRAGDAAATTVSGAMVTVSMALICLAILYGMAALMAKNAIFSITSRRIVVRHGVGIRKYINLPFQNVGGVALKVHPSGHGDIALTMEKGRRIPFLHLWPFTRPLRLGHPVPLLRAVPNARSVSSTLAEAMNAWAPNRISLADSSGVRAGSTDTPSFQPHGLTAPAEGG
ncbi:MAG: PH domain-containing protein [Parvularculaceae bacterium]|nr:PH domain-containing protein [Parvularculaceae bacterium]